MEKENKKLFIHIKRSLEIEEPEFFILAKDKEEAQKQWYKVFKQKLLLNEFTEIPNIEKTNIFTFNKEDI